MKKTILFTQKPTFLSTNDSFGDASRTTPSFSNPLNIFLGKNVIVEADYNNIVITGRLIHYQIGNRQKPHRPFILILENGQGKHVLRGNFVSISEGAVK